MISHQEDQVDIRRRQLVDVLKCGGPEVVVVVAARLLDLGIRNQEGTLASRWPELGMETGVQPLRMVGQQAYLVERLQLDLYPYGFLGGHHLVDGLCYPGGSEGRFLPLHDPDLTSGHCCHPYRFAFGD